MRRSAAALAMVLVLGGIVLVAGPVSRHVQRVRQHHVYATAWDEIVAGERTPDPNAPLARMWIPAVGVDTWVVNDPSGERMKEFPCGTLMGSAVLIAAHRDLHFRPLDDLEIGHGIEFELQDGSWFSFRVLEILVLPADRATKLVLEQADTGRLVLTTCYPFEFVGPAPDRFVALAAREDARPRRAP